MSPPATTRTVTAAGPRRRRRHLLVTTVVVLGLVPTGSHLVESQTVSASPGAKPPTEVPLVDPETQGRVAEGLPSAPDGIRLPSPTDVPGPRTPRLKPPKADRSDEVIALLKNAVAATAEAATAAVEGATVPSISESPTPQLKPATPDLDPITAHFERVLGDASDRRPAVPGAAELPVVSAASAETSPRDSTPQDDSIASLRRELRTRDAVIANLLQRVEQLERRVVLTAAQLDQAVAGAAPPRPGIGSATGTPAAAAPEPAPKPEEPGTEQVAAASQESDQGAAAPPAAPGQFEVDEDAIDRALERTLVEQGVLLLPAGQAEMEPSFSYTREVIDAPTFVTENGVTFVGEQQVRRNEFATAQTLRVGLPFDAQAEVTVPYRYVDQSTVTKVGFGDRSKSSSSGYGLGDIRVGLAKTLLRENGGWWPDLVGRIRWDTDTGKSSDGDVPLGGGFNEISGSLSAVKRQDPLAFVAGISYERAFEHNNVRPGDELGFSIGTVLAASPETSLSLSFSQSFNDEVEFDGSGVDGSDRVNGVLSIGAASILGRGLFVNTAVDIGLTDDAPDYAIRASVPIRFNLPVY